MQRTGIENRQTRRAPTACRWRPCRGIVSGILALAVAVSAAAQEEAPPAAQVRVTSKPADASVLLDGKVKGSTPLGIPSVAPGKHLLVVRKPGYREHRRTLALAPNQKLPIDISLEELTAFVLFHSTPSGAEVTVDGISRGTTPLLLSDVTLGQHRVRFTRKGFLPKDIALQVPDQAPLMKEVSLASSTAALSVQSEPSGAKVVVDGIAKGTTPCRIDKIPEGEAKIELSLDGHEPFEKTLRLRAGEQEVLTAVLKPIPAKLTIVSIPKGARIYVNNQRKNDAPVTLEDLVPGSYRIRAELEGHEIQARTIELTHAEERTEEFRLEAHKSILEVTTEPAGVTVFVDGEQRGITAAKKDETDRVSEPLQVSLLKLGEHTAQLTRKGYFEASFSFTAEKDKTVSQHVRLKRRFIPDYEVSTATETYRGVLVIIDALGNVRLEVRPGVFKTILRIDIKSRRPIREEDLVEEPQP